MAKRKQVTKRKHTDSSCEFGSSEWGVELKKKLKKLDKWMRETLVNPLDLSNFVTLIQLPRAQEIVDEMPEGELRDMASLAVSLLKDQEEILGLLEQTK